jgi:hypothetical protein
VRTAGRGARVERYERAAEPSATALDRVMGALGIPPTA